MCTEFYGVDKAKHGEVAYPTTAWIENQYTSTSFEPVGPVGKSGENMKRQDTCNLSKQKSPSHRDIVDPIELRASYSELRRGSSPALTLDPKNLLEDKVIGKKVKEKLGIE